MEKKQKPTGKKNTALASFKHTREKGFIRNRIFASIIDYVIIAFICQLAFVFFGTPDLESYRQMQDIVQGLARDAPEVMERTRLWNQFMISALIIGGSYEALMLILFGSTPGKLIFGFKVLHVNMDHNIIIKKLLLLLRAVVKALSIYLLSAVPYILLCITTFGNAEGRSGFDTFSGTTLMYNTTRKFTLFKR